MLVNGFSNKEEVTEYARLTVFVIECYFLRRLSTNYNSEATANQHWHSHNHCPMKFLLRVRLINVPEETSVELR